MRYVKSVKIEGLSPHHLTQLKDVSDQWIGSDYFSLDSLKQFASPNRDENLSLVLLDSENQICGFRLTEKFPFESGLINKCHEDLWPFSIQRAAYFKSLFIKPEWTGVGLGLRLSQASIERARQQDFEGIFCHSWKESPHQSSVRYLQKLGFVEIAEHPLFWSDVNYHCTRCGNPPCQCTAIEMIKEL